MGFLQLADFSYGLEREWVQFNFLMHPPKTVCRDPMRSFLAAHAGQQGFVNVTTTYLLRIVSDGSKVHLEGYISAPFICIWKKTPVLADSALDVVSLGGYIHEDYCERSADSQNSSSNEVASHHQVRPKSDPENNLYLAQSSNRVMQPPELDFGFTSPMWNSKIRDCGPLDLKSFITLNGELQPVGQLKGHKVNVPGSVPGSLYLVSFSSEWLEAWCRNHSMVAVGQQEDIKKDIHRSNQKVLYFIQFVNTCMSVICCTFDYTGASPRVDAVERIHDSVVTGKGVKTTGACNGVKMTCYDGEDETGKVIFTGELTGKFECQSSGAAMTVVGTGGHPQCLYTYSIPWTFDFNYAGTDGRFSKGVHDESYRDDRVACRLFAVVLDPPNPDTILARGAEGSPPGIDAYIAVETTWDSRRHVEYVASSFRAGEPIKTGTISQSGCVIKLVLVTLGNQLTSLPLQWKCTLILTYIHPVPRGHDISTNQFASLDSLLICSDPNIATRLNGRRKFLKRLKSGIVNKAFEERLHSSTLAEKPPEIPVSLIKHIKSLSQFPYDKENNDSFQFPGMQTLRTTDCPIKRSVYRKLTCTGQCTTFNSLLIQNHKRTLLDGSTLQVSFLFEDYDRMHKRESDGSKKLWWNVEPCETPQRFRVIGRSVDHFRNV
ncbi:hypothetical protein CLF_109845 [Clonorchis sinensis]|uniref:Uncharacterized protein n=1 Tax=Clonorchis sinensis TaxID=79923 RepID=G7YSZ7_CLOSI|nr:hypothetical protein CLF_109845 [Clonorchis sinensis]